MTYVPWLVEIPTLCQYLLQFPVYFLAVAECKVTSYTGVSGIMIRETAETFGIITQDDKFRGNWAADSNFKLIKMLLVQLMCFCELILEMLMVSFICLGVICSGAQKVFCFYISSWLLEDYLARGQTHFKKLEFVIVSGDQRIFDNDNKNIW